MESKRPERRVTALLLLGMLDLHRRNDDRWSPVTDGLQTRLTVELDSHPVGTPLKLRLEVKNVSNEARVLGEQAHVLHLRGLDPDLREIPPQTVTFPLPKQTRTIPAEGLFSSSVELPTGRGHTISQSGQYLIQLHNDHLPPTNVLGVSMIDPKVE